MRYCPVCGTKFQSKGKKHVCSFCGFVDYGNPILVIAVIVKIEEKIVIVHSKGWTEGFWGLPGGYVEPGESLEKAAIREVKEETNLNVRLEGFVSSYPFKKPDANLIFAVFVATALTNDIKPGKDVLEVLTLPPVEALKHMTGKLAKKAVIQWLERPKNFSLK